MKDGTVCFCCSAEEDASELDRLRRLLCIPRADVDKVNKEICGRIYQEVRPLPSLASGTDTGRQKRPTILHGSVAGLTHLTVCKIGV